MSVSAKNHETEGLLSPVIRSLRLKQAAALIPAGSTVIDLACGAGFLRGFLPRNCRYYGVDRILPPNPGWFDGFLHGELTAPDFFEELRLWLPQKADVVTMLAFVEHVKSPEFVIRKLTSVLKENGKVILTTPHPVGRKLHDFLARLYICSPSGAAEHEKFLNKADLDRVSRLAGFSMLNYRRFLFGLNQIVEIKPLSSSA